MPSAAWFVVRAPFAAYRWMQAGSYRATSPVMPPSAAWGLLLNLAAVEIRGSLSETSTPIRADAPPLRLALGIPAPGGGTPPPGGIASLFQQLHVYPVGAEAAKEFKEGARGAKYSISPARRELLVDFACSLGVADADPNLLAQIRAGLEGRLEAPRYGLPFAGDNNLLFDSIDAVEVPPASFWYERVDLDGTPRKGSCRLTIGIDRGDSSRTTMALYAPTTLATVLPPEGAWTWVPADPSGSPA